MKSRDGWLLALVALPVLTVVALLVASSITWHLNSDRVSAELVSRFGREIATAPAPVDSDLGSTSTEQSEPLAEMLRCAEAIEAKHSYLVQFEFDRQEVLPEDRKALEEMLAEYASDLEALRAAIDRIDFRAEPIWTPIEHGRPAAWAGTSSQLRAVWRLLRTDVVASVSGGENDVALDSLERMMTMATTPLKPQSLHTEISRIDGQSQFNEAIRLVLTKASWTPEQLRRLDALLAQVFPFRESWKHMLRNEQLAGIRGLRGDLPGRYLWFDSASTGLAPSQRLEWLEYHQRLGSYADGTPTRLVSRLAKGWSDQPPVAAKRLDTLVSFPFAEAGRFADSSKNGIAETFMQAENDRKFYRTGVALLRYRSEHGAFPKKLDELTQIGFPESESVALNQWQFGYRLDEMARLINDGRGERWDGRLVPTETVIAFPRADSEATADQ